MLRRLILALALLMARSVAALAQTVATINSLPAAVVPLTGGEMVPIWQSSSTKKVSISDVIAVYKATTAPSAPYFGQYWWDTSASPADVLRIYDGAQWALVATLNTTSHSFTASLAQITIGLTAIVGGSNGSIEYNNGGLLGEKTTSGTGSVIPLQTSPTLITPNFGAMTGTGGSITFNGVSTTKKYSISNGDWYTTAVPFFQGNSSGDPGIVDIMPKGIDGPSWLDILGNDYTLNPGNTLAATIGVCRGIIKGPCADTRNYAYVGPKELGTYIGTLEAFIVGSEGIPTWFGDDDDPANHDGQWAFFRDFNSKILLSVTNPDAGVHAYSIIEAKNALATDNNISIQALGTGFTDGGGTGGLLANYGVLQCGANLSGCSIISRGASASMFFYTGGFAPSNLALTITSAQAATFAKSLAVTNAFTAASGAFGGALTGGDTVTITGQMSVSGTVNTGAINANSDITLPTGSNVIWSGQSKIHNVSDGIIRISNNAASAAQLDFGNTSNAFPAIKQNGTALNFILADASGDAPITSRNLQLSAAAPTVAASQIGFGATTAVSSNCGSLAGASACLIINVAGTTRYIPFY